jgi:3-hydroxyisobutyrate dehydrogenase
VSVGLLGVGRMGLPIVRALLDAGHAVAAFDVDAARVSMAVAAGATPAGDLVALAASADVFITVLPGAPEVDDAAPGAIAGLREGALWIDLTSNDPRVAERLAELAASRRVDAVGAPMAGGVAAAETGTLGFFVGGSPAAVDRARPVLAALGPAEGVVPVGASVGSGYVAKLLANTLWFGQAIAVTEALLLGRSLGLAPRELARVLAQSAGGSVFIDRHLDALLAGDYLETFGIDRVVDELELVTRLAREGGTPHDLTEVVARLHRQALDRFGAIDGELLGARLLEERAGEPLSSDTPSS